MGKTHEDITYWLVKDTEVGDILNSNGFNKISLSKLSVGKLGSKELYKNQIISGAVDVDKLDFISRDSYHTGAGYGYIDIFRFI